MDAEVVIVGGGPVGLFLALRLESLGVRVRVFEKRRSEHGESRSIGIHPPSLEMLESLGVIGAFLERGVRVRAGRAYGPRGLLGRVSFGRCRAPFRFVLSIPQHDTERILAAALEARAPGALVRNVEVLGLRDRAHAIEAQVDEGRWTLGSCHAPFAVVCDGRWSAFREARGIAYRGGPYEGEYVMGDGWDRTAFGDEAAVFLGADGLVESFPLPGNMRRWVARRSTERPSPAEELASVVAHRTGIALRAAEMTRVGVFRAERWMADRFVAGRVLFAGDAAHVVSPIGGQGMNLGWLGADRFARALVRVLRREASARALDLAGWRHRVVANAAARRAELNMWLGAPSEGPARRALLRALLRSGSAPVLADLFTMRGLAWGI